MAKLALVKNLVPPLDSTRTCHGIDTLPSIALLAISVGIELAFSSARVISVKSQQHLSLTDIQKKLKHISYGQAEVNITVIPD